MIIIISSTTILVLHRWLSTVFFCLFLVRVQLTAAQCTPAYAHRQADFPPVPSQPKWMAGLDDGALLNTLSIPGTHDTGALFGCDVLCTQVLTIRQQLDHGIRFMDIRLRHIDNRLAIHHEFLFQHLWFHEVLNNVSAFLHENPSETVLMRVKEEYRAERCNRSFEATFAEYAENFSSLIWKRTSDNPTLGQIRARLVFLQDFTSSSQQFGIPYAALNAQDSYELANKWELYGKWEKVKAQLRRADMEANRSYKRNNGTTTASIFLNYLSGSGGTFPYFVASGHINSESCAAREATGAITPFFSAHKWPDFPRIDCFPFFFMLFCKIAFEGTNTLTYEFIRDQNNNNGAALRCVGIVAADFPGQGLIDAIIGVNNNKH